MGLRERKKEQTRQAIADAALRLFAEHGFDRVPVAAVAQEADVSTATVFNYFPNKEDLFYSGLDAFGDRLVDAVAARPAGQGVLEAFREYLACSAGLLDAISDGDHDALERSRTVHRIAAGSAALQAREQQSYARYAAALAEQLGVEARADGAGRDGAEIDEVGIEVVTTALVGVHRVLVDMVRRRILDDDRPRDIAADYRVAADRAFSLLEHGLAGYRQAPSEVART